MVTLVKKPYFWILILIAKVSIWIRQQWNPDLLILQGPYEVDRSCELGSGTYGIVWIGRHVQTRDEVAVKKVKVTELTKKFVDRELSLLSECHHRNIIKLLWSEQDNDCRYFVMEYCIHGNLNTFIKDKQISIGLCVKFMLNIARAVDHLHMLSISHRDIKPTNILVSDQDGYFLKLADFGLARYFPTSSSGIAASLNTGTLGWMAPEIHDDSSLASRYNKSADVFSLGLLFLALVRHELGNYLAPLTGKNMSHCYVLIKIFYANF
jgi:serine/threonine protein kinase